MRLKEHKKINYIYAFLLIFILWQITSMIFNNPIFPPISKIITNIFNNFYEELAVHVLYSLKRIILGIFTALAVGIPLGILMGYFKNIDKIFTPFLYFSYPVPKMTLLPIVMLIFGLGDLSKITMIFLITFFPIVVNVRDEVRSIPDEVYYPVYSLGASRLQIIKEIILPGIIPAVLTSLRIGTGTAVSVLFFTESFGTQYGMGYFIMDSYMRINYIQMYSGIFMLSMIGLLIFILIDILEFIICPWK